MATPGWYPDPSGRPGAYRYWDGQAWGPDVTDNPYGAPSGSAPGVPAPPNPFDTPTTPPGAEETQAVPTFQPSYQPTYQPYGGQPPQSPQSPPSPQGWSSTPAQPSWAVSAPPSGGGGGGAGKVVGLVLLALVVIVALGVGTFFVVRSFDDDGDTRTAGDSTRTDAPTADPSSDAPTDAPTDTPTDAPTDPTDPVDPAAPVDPFTDPGEPTIQQCEGGAPAQGASGETGNQLTGGGLTMRKVRGFSTATSQAAAFTFADGVLTTSRTIQEPTEASSGWVAVYALGGLDKSHGYNSPGQAASVVLECMALSEAFYQGVSSTTLLDSSATTVGGNAAWVMDAEIKVDNPGLTVEGDIAKVVVVDTGDPQSYGLFISVVPIGDQALISQQETQAGLLQVG